MRGCGGTLKNKIVILGRERGKQFLGGFQWLVYNQPAWLCSFSLAHVQHAGTEKADAWIQLGNPSRTFQLNSVGKGDNSVNSICKGDYTGYPRQSGGKGMQREQRCAVLCWGQAYTEVQEVGPGGAGSRAWTC